MNLWNSLNPRRRAKLFNKQSPAYNGLHESGPVGRHVNPVTDSNLLKLRVLRPLEHRCRVRPLWTIAELELLGTLPDVEVAKRTRRPLGAVRQKRWKLQRNGN